MQLTKSKNHSVIITRIWTSFQNSITPSIEKLATFTLGRSLLMLAAFSFLFVSNLQAQTCFGTDSDADGVADMCDIDDDNDGMLYTAEGSCGFLLDWDAEDYTNGSINETIHLSNATSILDAKFKMSGDISHFYSYNPTGGTSTVTSPNNADNWINNRVGETGSSSGLTLLIDPATSNPKSNTKTSITFCKPIPSLAFSISDIDNAYNTSNGSRDRVIIYGFYKGTKTKPIGRYKSNNPTFSINNSFNNNTEMAATAPWGYDASSDNNTQGTLNVFFYQKVDSVVIEYIEFSSVDNPAGSGIGIGNLYIGLEADGDEIANHLDVDAYNDGIVAMIKASVADNIRGSSTSDINSDGLLDIFDHNTAGIAGCLGSTIDEDANLLPDYLDLYTYGDGIPNWLEEHNADEIHSFLAPSSSFYHTIDGGVDFIGISKVSVYPNPAHDKVDVSLEGEINGDLEITLTDIFGKVHHNQQMSKSDYLQQGLKIDLSAFRHGYYFLQVTAGGQVSTVKVLVEN